MFVAGGGDLSDKTEPTPEYLALLKQALEEREQELIEEERRKAAEAPPSAGAAFGLSEPPWPEPTNRGIRN